MSVVLLLIFLKLGETKLETLSAPLVNLLHEVSRLICITLHQSFAKFPIQISINEKEIPMDIVENASDIEESNEVM